MASEQTWFDSVFGRVASGLDYVVDDWIGGWSGRDDTNANAPVYGLGGAPYYPEQTPPVSNSQPVTYQPFSVGNNVPTYAMGAGALLVGFLLYKVVK